MSQVLVLVCRLGRWLVRLQLRFHENHIQVSNTPAIRGCRIRIGPGHLGKLDPLLAILGREALGDNHMAFALAVWR
ncbi:MAG: hypothetical protein WCB12_15850 [Bryobacteraceae bacterium]